MADEGDGVLGEGKNGVHGRSRSKTDSGVWGENTSDFGGFGVKGQSKTGEGVFGQGGTNGVHGKSGSPTDSGVWGENTGSGTGVAGNSFGGFGVGGQSQHGYGGQFTGGLAPLHLTPGATKDHPASGTHKRGEFYVGSAGSLFYCNADGVPGNWVKLA